LGVLLAAVALTLTWGAALDPAETVAGLHGTLDSVALQIRLPGAGLVVALGILVAVASLVWGLREQATLLVGSWAALLATSLAVYLVLPGIMRSGRVSAADPLDPGLQGERRRLEQLAFGTEWLEERGPPGFTTPEAAVGALPVWDAERVAGVARRAHLLGPTGTAAAAALSPHRLGGGRAPWLVGAAPDLDRLARTQPLPPWTEIHRGSWARMGGPLAAAEADSGLELALVPGGDSVTWFGDGFGEFAVAAPDTWPRARRAGIPLTTWWRRTAHAWVLQSPELTRAETDGLVLLWRRDVAERLAPRGRPGGGVPRGAPRRAPPPRRGLRAAAPRATRPRAGAAAGPPRRGGPLARGARGGGGGGGGGGAGATRLWVALGFET